MGKRVEVEKSPTGFKIKPSKERLEKIEREERIKERKKKPSKNPSPTEIMEAISDMNSRLEEIYDLIKGK